MDVLFVTSKTAFCKTYLEYHDSLQFRGYLSVGAIAFATKDVVYQRECHRPDWFRVQYQNARFNIVRAGELLSEISSSFLH